MYIFFNLNACAKDEAAIPEFTSRQLQPLPPPSVAVLGFHLLRMPEGTFFLFNSI